MGISKGRWEHEIVLVCLRSIRAHPLHIRCLPAGSCKACGMQLIHVNKYMETKESQNMFDDAITIKDGCAVRTFTCKGKDASIQLYSMSEDGGGFSDELTPGTATTTVTCNAAGTAWLNTKEMPITNAVCAFVPACRNCERSAITESGFDKSGEEIFGDCVMRKFTCPGVGSSIEVSAADGPVRTVNDDGTGMATYTVTCNDNVQWADQAKVITAVKCVKGPACKQWMKDTGGLIVYGEGGTTTSQDMTDDQIGGSNGEGDTDGTTATLTLTCNADESAWEYMGFAIEAVECYYHPPCKDCAFEWITDVGLLVNKMEDYPVTGCKFRTFGCTDRNKKLVLSTAAGEVKRIAGDELYYIPCAKDGSGWVDGTNVITKGECADKGCKDCAESSLSTMANPTGAGAKDMADNMENATGACVTRTMTCNGNAAAIEFYNGAEFINQIGGTPGVNTQVYPFTCNADGEMWSIPGVVPTIKGVQCAALP